MHTFMIKQVLCLLCVATLATCLTYSVDTQGGPLAVVSEKFLSVALDCSNIEGRFSDFNLTDPNLTKLVNHLSPMYFRVGGTYADRIVFSEENLTKNYNSSIKLADITLLASDWLKLHQFTKNANVRLIFDLNSLLRNNDGTWNSENAEKIIKFSHENGIETDWELGNEPDLYNAIYNDHVDATQLGTDYKTLRAILDKYEYNSSYLVGPDMFDVGGSSANQQYLSQFLESGSEAINAVTWHQYYFSGKDATEDMFLNPATFNYLEQRLNVVKNVVNNVDLTKKIWMGETSTAYSGGAAGMSDRFLATFLWLDKLGLGAKLGMDVIIRQTIFHDYYALLNDSYSPNPDWWISVFHKKLVGSNVISMKNDATETSKTRLYAHCAKNMSAAVVVFGLNVDSTASSFNLTELESDNDVYVYELTSDGSLYSQYVQVNGEVLNLTPDYELPTIQPKVIAKSNTYTMPPYSIVFWVFTNTNVNACKL